MSNIIDFCSICKQFEAKLKWLSRNRTVIKTKMIIVILLLGVIFPKETTACNRALTYNAELLEGLFDRPVVKGTITRMDVDEISGIAASRRHSDILYALQDSGHKPVIYAINSTDGQIVAEYTIRNAINGDWEDIAVGHGPYGQFYIYIGDVGNHWSSRADTIYRLREPLKLERKGELEIHGLLRYKWDEPNCETMMVDEKGTLFLITKIRPGGERPKLYEIPKFNLRYRIETLSNGTSVAIDLETDGPTGGDISISGREVLVRTYSHIYYWRRDLTTSIAETLARTPVRLPQTRVEPQGESICWDTEEEGFYTISEGPAKPLYYYRRGEIGKMLL